MLCFAKYETHLKVQKIIINNNFKIKKKNMIMQPTTLEIVNSVAYMLVKIKMSTFQFQDFQAYSNDVRMIN